jgi:phospho-N-acetylmuramoyl-pentapeptide-transferase
MLYNTLLYQYFENHGSLGLRAALAFVIAMTFSLYFMPKLIKFQKDKTIGQPILKWLGAEHQAKQGKPTMGGLVIIASAIASALIIADLSSLYIWILISASIMFGSIGLADDVLKIYFKHSAGLHAKLKLIFQLAASLVSYFWMKYHLDPAYITSITFPLIKGMLLDLGIFYIPFACVVMIGTSNAVNLTDGLDGLATVPIAICLFVLGIIAYLTGDISVASGMDILYIENSAEIAIFCASLIGACMGFLWYNCAPADIMMGDVGALGLGGVIGLISIMIKHEITLAIIGGLFVMETLSVMMQVYYFKITGGKRIFKMAPLHHHFEKIGWSENKIVVRFWICALIFAILGLATI